MKVLGGDLGRWFCLWVQSIFGLFLRLRIRSANQKFNMSKKQDSPSLTGGYFAKGWEIKAVLIAVMLMIGAGTVYWFLKPATEPNMVLNQDDILQGIGMSKEIADFRKSHKGEEPLWTSRIFSGMPAYQVSTYYHGNLMSHVEKVLRLDFILPHPLGQMFLLFLGMFILLSVLRVDPITAGMGSMAFLLSSYFFIILDAGHNSKVNAIAYVPMILSGFILAYRGRFFMGGALTALFMALAINANHVQITYYGMFIIVAVVLSAIGSALRWPNRIALFALLLAIPIMWALKLPGIVWKTCAVLAVIGPLVSELFMQISGGALKGGLMGFLKGRDLAPSASAYRTAVLASLTVLLAGVAAIGPNSGRLWTNQDYLPETMRGGPVLKRVQIDGDSQNDGLTKAYAYRWSYGKAETFTLINPYYQGDAYYANVGKDSETHDIISRVYGQQAADVMVENWPLYFGPQPPTSGPVFVGAIIFFLSLLGLLVVPDRYRWWLLAPTILGIMLSWGRFYQPFSDLFFDNLPLYNKFRAVSMMLVIAEITMPILATLAVVWFISNPNKRSDKDQFIRLGIAGGATLLLFVFLLAVAPGTNDFALPSGADSQRIGGMLQRYGIKPDPGLVGQLTAALADDREAMFNSGMYRGMLFVLLAGGILFAVYRFARPAFEKPEQKLYPQAIAGLGLFVLVMLEMVPINKRYINENDFVPRQEFMRPFNPSKADNSILADPDPNYRVLNMASDTWNDAITCYHHKSIGGYNAAKLRRYQDLISLHLDAEMSSVQAAMSGGGDNQEIVTRINAALASSPVLNMLNCKYLIYNPEAPGFPNSYRYGNAWVVQNAQIAAASSAAENDADVAIEMLGKVNLRNTMVVEKEFESQLQGFTPSLDTNASVTLTSFQANAVSYKFNAPSGKEQLVVFSEIYFNSGKGWQAYLDGKAVEHFRCDYILRGMRVPGGTHTIEFKFEPKSYAQGESLGYALSFVLFALIGGLVYLDYRTRSKNAPVEDDPSELV